ncbi:MAG: C25 family cysteine peptidase, partial [bacterium]|nr:C25 family cysteine peptidase [bacterium]
MMPRFTLLLCLLLATTVFGRPWTPDDDNITGIPEEGAIQIVTDKLGVGHYRIRFLSPDVKIESVELEKQSWSMISIAGETRLWQTGKPQLPAVSRAIRIPNRGNVDVRVLHSEYIEYPNIDVLPQQVITAYSEEGKFTGKLEFDSVQYHTDEFYPGELFRVSEPSCIRDARFILLGVQPVQANPVTRTLRVYTEIELEVLPIGGEGVNELGASHHPVPSFASLYRDIIGAEDLIAEANEASPGQIMIVCRPGAVATIQAFADWKTLSGRPTQIVTTTTTSPNDIIATIRNAYNTWQPPLESVLLVGDGGGTTTTYELPAPIGLYNYQTDNIYGELVGTDLLVDVWVARLSATSQAELQLMVNRTINYERNPLMTDTTWYTRGWGYAGITQNSTSNIFAIRYCLQQMNQRGILNTMYDEHVGNVSSSLISQRLSPGAIFWAHRPALLGELNPSDLTVLSNVNKCFVSVNTTCSSGNWYGTTTTAVSEAVIRQGTPTAPTGGLSGMSTALPGSTPPYNNCVVTGMYYGLGLKNARISAQMYFEGKYQLWRNFHGYTSYSDYFIHWNNVMGDLTVQFWTGVPQYLTHNIPTVIGLAQNSLLLNIQQNGLPVNEALVTVWKKNSDGITETYCRATTDATGNVLLSLTNQTTGELVVSVVGNRAGDNFYPIIDTIQVTQMAFDLGVSQLFVDDDTTNGTFGNQDGKINPIETVDLSVRIQNRGLQGLTGISGVLRCDDPRISIIDSTASWLDVAVDSNATSADPFRIMVVYGISDNTDIPVQLLVTTNQAVFPLFFNITVRSYHARYVSFATSPTVIQPGNGGSLTLRVTNTGGQAISTPVEATLVSLSPYITVTSDISSYLSLPMGDSVTNSAVPWTIQSDVHTIPGSQLPFQVIFSTPSMSDTILFTMSFGSRSTNDPTGPDLYGYYAYDNSDTGYEPHPTFDWIEIITNGLGTRLALNDNGETFDDAVGIRTPFPVQYYGVPYDSMTVCSNGWAAFGDYYGMHQDQYANFRNWRLPPVEGPRNIVAVFWDDLVVGGANGVYYYSDSANHRYVITWKGQMAFGARGAEEFQLVVFDQNEYPTPTGDAKLLFQYKNFYNGTGQPMLHGTDVDYGTIGIANRDYTSGFEYTYWSTYTPGSRVISNGMNVNRAILFTTEQYLANGVTQLQSSPTFYWMS